MKRVLVVTGFVLLYHSCYAVISKMVVLSRNGDRTPSVLAFGKYPACFKNVPQGQLTEAGQNQMKNLGEMLRTKYGDFFGSDPKQVKVSYSDFHRNEESAKLIFSTLYHSSNFKEQDFEVLQEESDGNMGRTYEDSFNQLLNENDYKSLIDRLRNLNVTNFELKNLFDVHLVMKQINCMKNSGCCMPSWWKDPLDKEMVAFNRQYFNNMLHCDTYDVVKSNDGLLQEINHFFADINGQPNAWIISAQDITIAKSLARMGRFNGLQPPTGSTVIFILEDQEYHTGLVRMHFYNNTDYKKAQVLLGPSGRDKFPFFKFVTMNSGPNNCI